MIEKNCDFITLKNLFTPPLVPKLFSTKICYIFGTNNVREPFGFHPNHKH